MEVFGGEKHKALSALIDKYSKQYKEAREEYIRAASNRVKIIKVNIEHISGKARR
ncbi:hypothetical protein CLLI_20870 [Clostridium liquoris]|uniref:Uncharacterized protein n=1 Tax=Clostridium liquoris TaxID=1289519 RepID=A0A2T0B286_9CLOT|nr:hypothetical protein CLLI_20870 [Clostridium liquoris]